MASSDKEVSLPVKEQNPNDVGFGSMPNEQASEKKKALLAEIRNGIKEMMTSDSFKDYLNTRAHLFTRKYSSNNAISIYLRKPEASYVMGYEQWAHVGRTPLPKTGIPVLAPVFYYEKNAGALYKTIKANLTAQLASNETAAYRIGQSGLELTMLRGSNSIGMRFNGKEVGFLESEKQQREFIDHNILNKIPAYYTVAYVFDVADTVIKDKIYVNREDAKKEDMVLDKDGNPIRGKGAFHNKFLVYNTAERQSRFHPKLDLSVEEIDPEKIKVLKDALIAVSKKNGIPVTVVDRESDKTLSSGADGYFHRPDGNPQYPRGYIIMPKDLMEKEPTAFVSTLIHEMAHSDLHGDLDKLAKQMGEKSIARDMREIQAEATAYLVAKQFGIETSTASFGYLAVWSQGFDLQSFEKSLTVIDNEAQKIISELSSELHERGLTIDLREREKDPLTDEQTRKMATEYVRNALTVQRDVAMKLESVPKLLEEFGQQEQLLSLVYQQKQNLDLQMQCTDKQLDLAQKLEEAKDRPKQDQIIEELNQSAEYLKNLRLTFDDQTATLSRMQLRDKVGLKERYMANPQKILKAMARKDATLGSLSETQLNYIAKSAYIRQNYAKLLNKNPNEFIQKAVKRAEDVEAIMAKNGSFVEITSCEKWQGGKIFDGGELMHPKVADTIIKEGEAQIRSLKQEAQAKGKYVPYIQCEVHVFTVSEKAKNLMAYACKLHLGDGLQNSLADFLHKTAGNRTDMMMHFDVALREKNTKDKIIDFAYVEQKVPEEKEKKTKKEKTLGKE